MTWLKPANLNHRPKKTQKVLKPRCADQTAPENHDLGIRFRIRFDQRCLFRFER